MNSEVKEKWLQALRSGKYKQGNGFLRRNDTYCCLGVLSELAVAEGVIPAPVLVEDEDVPNDELYHYDSNACIPSPKVNSWAGIPRTTMVPRISYETTKEVLGEKAAEEMADVKFGVGLASLNDSGISFAKIADMIERDL